MKKFNFISMLLAGIFSIAFWLTALKMGTFAGADVAGSSLWMWSQLFHVLSAFFAIFGIVAIYEKTKKNDKFCPTYILAIIAQIAFLCDGILALVAFPVLAKNAPDLISVNGALFQSPAWQIFMWLGFAGYLLFGIRLITAKKWPIAPIILFALGGLVYSLSFPLIVWAIGGAMWGIGIIWLGFAYKLKEIK